MYRFTKEERLCSKKLIDQLFHNGSSFLLYPFRIVWLGGDLPSHAPVQLLISVPKKKFRRAVDRNLIRRRIREAYRLNKSEFLYSFLNERSAGLTLAISYIGNDISAYPYIEKKLIAALVKLRKEVSGSHVE